MRYHEDFVPENCQAAIRTERGIADDSRSTWARICPDLAAGAGIQRKCLLRTCGIQDAVGNQGDGLHPEVLEILSEIRSVRIKLLPERNRINPLQLQLAHIRSV